MLALTHPVAAMFDEGALAGTTPPVRRYGVGSRSIGELFMHMERANFNIDVLHELSPITQRDALIPSVLLLRARKLGV